MSDFDLDRINAIGRGIKNLYLSHNKQISESLLRDKASLLNENLLDVPLNKIEPLFKALCGQSGNMPSDAQIRAFWGENKSRVFGQLQSSKMTEYGSFDPNGVYSPHGTEIQDRHAIDQMDNRDLKIYGAILYLKNPNEEQIKVISEWEKKIWYPLKGVIQKYARDWTPQEYAIAEKKKIEINQTRERNIEFLDKLKLELQAK